MAAEVGFPNGLTSYPRESNYITRTADFADAGVDVDVYDDERKKKASCQSAGKRPFTALHERHHGGEQVEENGPENFDYLTELGKGLVRARRYPGITVNREINCSSNNSFPFCVPISAEI